MDDGSDRRGLASRPCRSGWRSNVAPCPFFPPSQHRIVGVFRDDRFRLVAPAQADNRQTMGRERAVVLGAFLLLGCAAALLVWTGAFEVSHTTSDLVLLAHRADRSTYLVGEIAHRV